MLQRLFSNCVIANFLLASVFYRDFPMRETFFALNRIIVLLRVSSYTGDQRRSLFQSLFILRKLTF